MAAESNTRQALRALVETMPEDKLAALLDFASYLQELSEAAELRHLQEGSSAYREWVAENDVYDKLVAHKS